MAQYKVYPQAAGAGNSALTEAGRTLEDLRDQARQVYLRLDFQIRCREDLERRMERSIRVLEEQSGDAYRLAAGISRAMERYRAAESDILRQTWGVKDVGGGAVAGDPTGNSASWWQDLLDNTYDFFSMLDREREVRIGKYRALLTHGHYYGVSVGMERLKEEARARGCDIAMFGHTHRPYLSQEEGLTVLNPGSLSFPRQDGRKPTYMLMEIDEDGEAHFTPKTFEKT